MRPAEDPPPDFGDAFRAHYPGLLAFVRRRVPPDDVEDLVAEVFAIAWDRWDTVPADVRPWLFGVARNVAANHARATGRRQRLELRAVGTSTEPAHDDGGMAFTAATLDLRVAWARLGDTDREAIALVAWDGLTGREAAQVLGCTRAAFSVRLTRARRRLARLLDDAPAEPVPAAPAPTAPAARAYAVERAALHPSPLSAGLTSGGES